MTMADGDQDSKPTIPEIGIYLADSIFAICFHYWVDQPEISGIHRSA